VVERKGKTVHLVEYGVIHAKKKDESMPLRLKMIFERLTSVVDRCLPDEMAIENIYYAKNVQSTVKLAHARAAAILPAVLRDIPTAEYNPSEIKRSVTGNGAASKEQVQYMVRSMLGIVETPEFFDATDALAVAIAHALKASAPKTRARSWAQFVAENPGKVKK
jgi:crossover junction endodeoxyribonuclease RuvC